MEQKLLTEKRKNENNRSKSPDRFINQKKPQNLHLLKKTPSPIKKNLTLNQKLTQNEFQINYENSLYSYLQQNSEIHSDTSTTSIDLPKKHPLFRYKKKKYRKIPEKAFKVLEAPGYKDDYYSHLLDWGKHSDISICINDEIYLHQFKTGKTQKLITSLKKVSCIKSSPFSHLMTFGENSGNITLYDPVSEISFCFKDMHEDRITCIDFLTENLLLLGSKDKKVSILDSRVGRVVKSWENHTQGVCGLKKNPRCFNVFASGGNDNHVAVFDIRNERVLWRFKAHKAAVRALAWDERNKNRLFTGGGSDDKKLKIWNLVSHKCELERNTDSQICELLYNAKFDEVISSHGFCSNNITVWKKRKLKKIAELKGHEQRVLDIAFSPNKNMIISASSDSSIRFWELYGDNKILKKKKKITIIERSDKKIRKKQRIKTNFIR